MYESSWGINKGMIISNNYERDMVFNVLTCKPNAAKYTCDLGKISKIVRKQGF
jgi:hypothetical protein